MPLEFRGWQSCQKKCRFANSEHAQDTVAFGKGRGAIDDSRCAGRLLRAQIIEKRGVRGKNWSQ
jgi:hypothetical protein